MEIFISFKRKEKTETSKVDSHGPMIDINNERKIDIVMAEIRERRSVRDKIRERGLQVVITATAAGGALAWLLLTKLSLNLFQHMAVSFLVFVLFSALFLFIKSLREELKETHEVLINAEDALRMYEKDNYLLGAALLPEKYRNSKPSICDFFNILPWWIVAVAVILGSLIISQHYIDELKPKNNQLPPEQQTSPSQT